MSLLSQCQNRSVGRGPKLELERGGSKSGAPKSEEDEIKVPKVEQRVQKYVGAHL